jgi:hypothetical protein
MVDTATSGYRTAKPDPYHPVAGQTWVMSKALYPGAKGVFVLSVRDGVIKYRRTDSKYVESVKDTEWSTWASAYNVELVPDVENPQPGQIWVTAGYSRAVKAIEGEIVHYTFVSLIDSTTHTGVGAERREVWARHLKIFDARYAGEAEVADVASAAKTDMDRESKDGCSTASAGAKNQAPCSFMWGHEAVAAEVENNAAYWLTPPAKSPLIPVSDDTYTIAHLENDLHDLEELYDDLADENDELRSELFEAEYQTAKWREAALEENLDEIAALLAEETRDKAERLVGDVLQDLNMMALGLESVLSRL